MGFDPPLMAKFQRPVLIALLLLAIGFLSDSMVIHARAALAQYLIKKAGQQTVDGAHQASGDQSSANQSSADRISSGHISSGHISSGHISTTHIKPWSWADTWPVARLQSVKHSVDLYVLNGAQGNVLAFGPGYLPGSTLPGSNGTSIIAGHRDTHFQFMQQLEQGDVLRLTNTEGRTTHYNVVALEVVDSSKQSLYIDQSYTDQQRAERDYAQLILVTCYPFDAIEPGGPLRYVARAVAVSSIF